MIPVVFFIGFVSVTAQIIDWESQQSVDRLLRRIYTQDERLGRIEERYNELTEKANHRIDIRKNAGNEAKRLMNVHVSDTMTGQWRGTEKFRCYPSLQEIGHVAVCDGVIDCKNGLDEANETCVNPVVNGSVWKGYPVYNHCNRDRCHHLTVMITSTKRPHWFSAFVQIRGQAYVHRGDGVSEITTRLKIVGAYSFGSRVLFVHSPRTRTSRLVVLAQFDVSSTTRCYGYEVRQATMETCAEYRFFRIK